MKATLEHTAGSRDTTPRDSFERLLIAQAQVDDVPLISGDATFDQYGIVRLW